ncbi:amidohydrolase family protein [Rhodococcus kronopolitis]|uniref:Amidohydrolase family protein n=1 Tax=Rhodococcus kronopolitis TaxID=1460226 RepID=A0ABV9FSF5_9NOCA
MFDAHVHILDPRFPLVENNGYLPEHYTIADYRARVDGFGVDGGAVVTASYQGTDQAYLFAALQELGPGWVGVCQLDADATDEDILALDRAGVRALRFNLRRSATDMQRLTTQALRAWDLVGWHAEFYVDASLLLSLEPVFKKLPAVSIDHLGMSTRGLPYLLNLVERGAKVKATGFGRATIDDVGDALRRVHAVNPEALMFGTDLPGTRARRAFEAADLDLIADAVGDDLDAVLGGNARAFYRITPPRPTE